jgi:membrane associated rhomboid family serine protease
MLPSSVIPVSDTVRSRKFPYVNLAIILTCIAVFIYQLTLPLAELNRFVIDYGVVPTRITDWVESPEIAFEPLTVFTSAFIHGGWLHLIFNMLFLWVFGDNVEDALGHVKYLAFYLVAAAGAAALQVAFDTGSVIPMVGASGAIAGVLGGYLVLYPKATVGVIIPWLWFLGMFPIPAVVLIVFWFILQLFAGIATLGAETAAANGVAVWAHVGGFLTGLGIMLIIAPFLKHRSRPTPPRRRGPMW